MAVMALIAGVQAKDLSQLLGEVDTVVAESQVAHHHHHHHHGQSKVAGSLAHTMAFRRKYAKYIRVRMDKYVKIAEKIDSVYG